MDSATINAYGSLIIGAANFGYAVWTKWSANRKVADANRRAATAVQQATQAADHSAAVGSQVDANRVDLEQAKKNIDELFTARLEFATFDRRLASNEKALLWLAGYVGVMNDDDDVPAPDSATTTGRHAKTGFTEAITTIRPQGDTP